MPTPKTKPGTALSDLARKVVAPTGIVSTGWPAVRDICQHKLGVAFDPWQDGAGRLILAKRPDGKLAVMIGGVGMSLPRQVGKTYLIGAMVFALCILMPGLLVIWSAHHARTHGETFLAMQDFAKRSKVRPYVSRVYMGSGDEEIRFVNGSRILFGARERGFGRGIPGVDMIVSDEAQIMSDKALDAQLATMNTSRFGLAIFVGTPPRPEDPSEAFTRMRTDAWAGTLQDAAWIEFGADSDGSPDDRRQWAKANPSYPHRTPTESILRLRRKLKPDSFMREGLGVWDDEPLSGLFRIAEWRALHDPKSKVGSGPVALAFDVTPDRRSGSIGVAGRRKDGPFHVEITGRKGVLDHRPGTVWMINRLTELNESVKPCVIVVDGRSPAAALLPDLEEAGLKVTTEPKHGTGEIIVVTNATEMAQACGGFFDAVTDSRNVRHIGQPPLDEGIEGVTERPLGDGAFGFSRKNSTSNISPIVSAALALHGLKVHGAEDEPADPWIAFV